MSHKLHVFSPELYHGTDKSRPYFEGWYFKQTTADNARSMAVIPGVYRGKTKSDDYAFIQVLFDGTSNYFKYSFDKFSFNKNKFEVTVGNSSFSLHEVKLRIDENNIKITADLVYSGHVPLKTNIVSPSIMGFFSYFSGMQCNHGVLSLSHDIMGSADIGGNSVDFIGGTGYIEKDWGEVFPQNWIWLQCNSKNKANEYLSFMCSVASIPYGPLNFTGHICFLAVGNKQYRFATYNGSKIKRIFETENGVSINIKKAKLTLSISATTHSSNILKAPSKTGMTRDILESLDATISIKLTKGGKTIYEGSHQNGGMEISEIGKLIK